MIGLVVGQTYEIAVFQTERNTTGSNYKLTLQGFNRTVSSCTPPAPPKTFVRDFEGICPVGNNVVWQLFRWKAGVPVGAQIDFRAATAAIAAALPASPPPAAPASVPIGTATNANSPSAGPVVFVYDTAPGPVPVPVSRAPQGRWCGDQVAAVPSRLHDVHRDAHALRVAAALRLRALGVSAEPKVDRSDDRSRI